MVYNEAVFMRMIEIRNVFYAVIKVKAVDSAAVEKSFGDCSGTRKKSSASWSGNCRLIRTRCILKRPTGRMWGRKGTKKRPAGYLSKKHCRNAEKSSP